MRLNAEKVLGISITTNSKKEILEYLQKYLENSPKSKVQRPKLGQKPLVIVTPNPEQIVYAHANPHFAQILNQADVAIPDGIGIAFASRFLATHYPLLTTHSRLERIPGVELMEELVGVASEKGFPIALIGGRAGLAVEAIECLRKKYSGLTGWADEPRELQISNLSNVGYLSYLSEKIRKTKTRIVFVGLGAPKQEYFIEALSYQLSASSHKNQKIKAESGQPKAESRIVLMSVGGSFDIVSGRLPRAPFALRALGLEWLWRLWLEPWRIGRQFALIRFVFLVIKTKLFV